MEKFILLGKRPSEIKAWVQEQGMPSFTARQLTEWIYGKRVRSFEAMTNISLKHRKLLEEKASLGFSEPISVQTSSDGTRKYLFGTSKGTAIECVCIPDGDRTTLCVSSQVGCKMHCAFCMTGRMGFKAQLATHEILNQVLSVAESSRLTNLVFMGMGEPCDNIDAVLRTIHILTSEDGFAWSPKRITLSSIGFLPGLERVLDETHVHIAISLHTPDELQRREWVPIEKAYPISKVLQMLSRYDFSHQRRLSFEYVMFQGQNDGLEQARKLVSMLKEYACRMNLIRFHSIPNTPFIRSEESRIQAFADYLNQHGLPTTIRASRGEDIQAACGLLSTSYLCDSLPNR